MRLSGWLIAGVLASLSASAFADAAFPTSYDANMTNFPGATHSAPGGGSHLNAVDGTDAIFTMGGGAVTSTMTVTLNFDPAALGGDLNVLIYHFNKLFSSDAGAHPTVFVDQIQWIDTSNNTATWDMPNRELVDDPYNSSVANDFDDTRETTIKLYGADDLSNYTLGGAFNRFQADTLVLTFAVSTVGGGEQWAMDAISNPEPGTMALFGLGALGLGGVAWRRRKAKLAKTA